MIAFLTESEAIEAFADKMTELQYATYEYVNDRCGHLTATGSLLTLNALERCAASLKISNGVQNIVILSNDPTKKSEFGYDVQFDNTIICKGSIRSDTNRSSSIRI